MAVDSDIQFMTRCELKNEITRLRDAIRWHRDQRLDDRCWMDDFELYKALPEGLWQGVDIRLLSKEQMMRNCDRYTTCRTVAGTPEEALQMYKQQLTEMEPHDRITE